MDHINGIKALITTVCAALTALWGWFGWLVLAWVVCMIIDYLTGSAAALRAGKWSSATARDGIWHKVGCAVAVIVAAILDMLVGNLIAHFPAIQLPFTYTVFFCPLVVIWYTLTECGSIIENAGALGAPVPSWLTKAIEALENAVDQTGDENDEKGGGAE